MKIEGENVSEEEESPWMINEPYACDEVSIVKTIVKTFVTIFVKTFWTPWRNVRLKISAFNSERFPCSEMSV